MTPRSKSVTFVPDYRQKWPISCLRWKQIICFSSFSQIRELNGVDPRCPPLLITQFCTFNPINAMLPQLSDYKPHTTAMTSDNGTKCAAQNRITTVYLIVFVPALVLRVLDTRSKIHLPGSRVAIHRPDLMHQRLMPPSCERKPNYLYAAYLLHINRPRYFLSSRSLSNRHFELLIDLLETHFSILCCNKRCQLKSERRAM